MRLDEWQRYIDSEFVEGEPPPAKPAAHPLKPVQPLTDLASPPAAEAVRTTENADPAVGDALLTDAPQSPVKAQIFQPESPAAEPTANINVEMQSDNVRALMASAAPVVKRQVSERAAIVGMEIEIAPFADYISARLGTRQSASSEAPDRNSLPPDAIADRELEALPGPLLPEIAANREREAAPETPQQEAAISLDAKVVPDAPPSDSRPVVQDNYPLAASRHTMAQLRLGAAGPLAKEEQAARHRKAALLRRLCDPILSLHDAALLLDFPSDSVLRATAAGVLTSCDPAPKAGQARRRRGEETGLPGFRLSDIVAFLAAKGSAQAE